MISFIGLVSLKGEDDGWNLINEQECKALPATDSIVLDTTTLWKSSKWLTHSIIEDESSMG
jgi:hypothetical protein